MQRKRDAALRSLRLMLAASVVLPASFLIYAAVEGYQRFFQLADERIEHALALSSAQAARVFQSVSITFQTVEKITADRSEQSLRAGEHELHERLKQIAAAVPEISSIWVLDANGDAIASTLVSPVPAAFNAPDRAYLKAQLAPDSDVHVGELVDIRLTGQTIFPISKRRFDSSGAFAGFALISVSPRPFELFYEPLAAKTGGSFALVRRDGALLARFPLPSTTGIVLGPTTGFGQLVARSPEGGKYTTISEVDQLERRFAVRRLDELPVYVSSSLLQKDILRSWLSYIASYLIFGVPATGLMVFLISLVMFRTSALYAEVAKREALEDTLRHSQRMEAIGKLSGGIAHDFNNLLMIIGGSLDALSRHMTFDSKGKRLIDAARLGVDRGGKLNQQLLAFARRQDLSFSAVCVADLLPNFLSLLERAVGDTVQVQIKSETGLWHCRTDAHQLETAILNLAINARDAMPNGGSLRIAASNASVDEIKAKQQDAAPGDYVVIEVIDTGLGMPKELIGRAFEPFFTTKEVGKGTGLGLSQVYGLARQSNGFVTLQSETGNGTIVTIYLPRVPASASSAATAASPQSVRSAGGRMLIVEDDPGVRNATHLLAEELDYSVVLASTAREALEILRHTKIDIVFSDVLMPGGMSGFDLAKHVERLHPEVPVLLTSGYVGEQAVAQHANRVLSKPYTLSEFAAALHRAKIEHTRLPSGPQAARRDASI